MTARLQEQRDDIIDGLRLVLNETLSLGERASRLKPDSQLLGAFPEFDSQAVLHVLMAIEEQFGITIEDDEVDAELFETMGGLIQLVSSKLNIE